MYLYVYCDSNTAGFVSMFFPFEEIGKFNFTLSEILRTDM